MLENADGRPADLAEAADVRRPSKMLSWTASGMPRPEFGATVSESCLWFPRMVSSGIGRTEDNDGIGTDLSGIAR
eukprot:scaffold8631_cov28-Tisochrysis_lutea.AAC.5